jgi:hypothetical protein
MKQKGVRKWNLAMVTHQREKVISRTAAAPKRNSMENIVKTGGNYRQLGTKASIWSIQRSHQ